MWDKEKAALEIYLEVLQEKIAATKRKLREEEEQIKQYKEAKEKAERLKTIAKDRTKNAKDEACRLTGVTDLSKFPENLREKLAQLPSTVSEVDELIHNCSARLSLMNRGDERIVKEYVNRQKRIEELSQKINRTQNEAALLKQQM